MISSPSLLVSIKLMRTQGISHGQLKERTVPSIHSASYPLLVSLGEFLILRPLWNKGLWTLMTKDSKGDTCSALPWKMIIFCQCCLLQNTSCWLAHPAEVQEYLHVNKNTNKSIHFLTILVTAKTTWHWLVIWRHWSIYWVGGNNQHHHHVATKGNKTV